MGARAGVHHRARAGTRAQGGAGAKPASKAAPKADPFAGLSDSDDEAGGNGEASAFAKEKGNAAFGAGRYAEAAKHFTLAINLDKANHILYSNRSGAFAAMGDGTRALSDADACVKKAPNWAKGYSRRGAAYVVLGRYKDAIEAYNAGLAIEPGNAGLQKGLDDLRQSIRDGEVPTAAAPEAAEAAPKANGMARPDLAPAPPAPAPAPAAAAVPKDDRPAAVRWAEAAKRGDRPVLEALIAECAALRPAPRRPPRAARARHRPHGAPLGGVRRRHDTDGVAGERGRRRRRAQQLGGAALHAAAGNGQAYAVEWLLANGADATAVNDDGETARSTRRGRRAPTSPASFRRRPRASKALERRE